ncbi:MAG: hypothetical protein Kow001_22450 [Acidobacteriota bacterium]
MSDTHPRVTVCRRISFSSGHRCFNPAWTEEENRRAFGSHYSEDGRGHNFMLEAYFEGPIDPVTGMVVNLKDIDRLLKRVTEPLDHHFLNTDVAEFRGVVPTAERIAVYCFERIREAMGEGRIRLRRVRLFEGFDLWVDCEEESQCP